jgi:hypothetical protein
MRMRGRAAPARALAAAIVLGLVCAAAARKGHGDGGKSGRGAGRGGSAGRKAAIAMPLDDSVGTMQLDICSARGPGAMQLAVSEVRPRLAGWGEVPRGRGAARPRRPAARRGAPPVPAPGRPRPTRAWHAPPLAPSQGTCTIVTGVLPPNATRKADAPDPGALVLSFPCAPSALRPLRAEGPALNLWAGVPGGPDATRSPNATRQAVCDVTTLNPVVYFHKVGGGGWRVPWV